MPLLLIALVSFHRPQLERYAFTRLEIAARLKVQLVETWIAERRGDSRVVALDTVFVEQVDDFRRHPAAADKAAAIIRRLDVIRSAYGYPFAGLLDPQGQLLIASGAVHEISAQTVALLPGLFSSGGAAQSQCYLDAFDGLASLNFVVPLQRTLAGKTRDVAAGQAPDAPRPAWGLAYLQIASWPAPEFLSSTTQLALDARHTSG